MLRQHPPGEKPSMVVMFAEPPSVVAIEGGQMAEGALGAAAVVLADCVEVPSPSPGNSSGTWELREAGTLIPPPTAEPDDVTASLVVAAEVPAENEEVEDSVDIGTPSGSVPLSVVV